MRRSAGSLFLFAQRGQYVSITMYKYEFMLICSYLGQRFLTGTIRLSEHRRSILSGNRGLTRSGSATPEASALQLTADSSRPLARTWSLPSSLTGTQHTLHEILLEDFQNYQKDQDLYWLIGKGQSHTEH